MVGGLSRNDAKFLRLAGWGRNCVMKPWICVMVVEIEYLDLDFFKKMLLLEYVLRDWIDFGK